MGKSLFNLTNTYKHIFGNHHKSLIQPYVFEQIPSVRKGYAAIK